MVFIKEFRGIIEDMHGYTGNIKLYLSIISDEYLLKTVNYKIKDNEEEVIKYKYIIENYASNQKTVSDIIQNFKDILINSKQNEFIEKYTVVFENDLENFLKIDTTFSNNDNLESVKKFREDIKNGEEIPLKVEDHVIKIFRSVINTFKYSVEFFTKKSNELKIIKFINGIKNDKKNIVLIGANGTGKSSLARKLNDLISDNFAIISSQHLLLYNNNNIYYDIKNAINKVHMFQVNNKNDDNYDELANMYNNDVDNLVTALFSKHYDNIEKFHKERILEKNIEIDQFSILDKVFNIWERLIVNRKLIYENFVIRAVDTDGNYYDFNNLSDGEKVIFYNIAHVLLSKDNSWIVVDEPENHLNFAICKKLWDILEIENQTCRFVYITHSSDFALSRTKKTFIRNNSFSKNFNWDFEVLNELEGIPESLLIELSGCREKILFCEGDEKSFDSRLYSILFPNYKVTPVKGHNDVISHCKAYNKHPHIFKMNAIGIIDKDYHFDSKIIELEKNNIFTLHFNEIENVLFTEEILKSVSKHHNGSIESVEKFKRCFFYEFENKKEQQIALYLNGTINSYILGHMIKAVESVEKIEKEFNLLYRIFNIEELIKNFRSKIDNTIIQKNYTEALKICNFKGWLISLGNKEIDSNYIEKALRIISDCSELKDNIRKKYFDSIIFNESLEEDLKNE